MNGYFAGGFAQGLGSAINQGRQIALDIAHQRMQQQAQELAQRRLDMQDTENQVRPYETMAARYPEASADALAAVDAIRNGRAGKPIQPIATAPSTPDVAQFQSIESGDTQPNRLTTLDDIVSNARNRVAGVEKAIKDRAFDLDRQYRQAQMDRMQEQSDLAREQLKQTGELKKIALQNQGYYRSPEYIETAARARAAGSAGGADNVTAIADGIQNGSQPPTMQGLYRFAGPVRAELAKRGYDLTAATAEWNAYQKHISSTNSTQQVRLAQALQTANESLDNIEALHEEWVALGGSTGYQILNKANLAASKQVPGRMGEVARALEMNIADLTSELGNAYMGGNSPTDHALSLAQKNLSADWNEGQFTEAIKQARKNIGYRLNAMRLVGPAGTPGNRYAPNGSNGTPGAGNATPQRKTINGKTYEKHSDGWYEVQ